MPDSNKENVFEKTTVNDGKSSLDIRKENRVKTYNAALQEKRFITGEEVEHFGLKADYTHLEFMLAASEHNRVITHGMESNHAEGLYAFWHELMKYLGPLLKEFQKVSESYASLIDDDSDMLTSMSRLKIDFDLFEEYVKKEMPNKERIKWRHWYKAEKKIIDDKIAKIATDEKFRQSEEDRIRKETKERSKK